MPGGELNDANIRGCLDQTEHQPLAPFDTSIRPDGGVTVTNAPVQVLLQIAWPSETRGELFRMPKWVADAGFDVVATAIPGRGTPSAEQRRTMMRAMLVDRFKLLWHTEMREVPAYDLIDRLEPPTMN